MPRGAHQVRTAKRPLQSPVSDVQKHAALRYILDAWEEALHDGIEPEMLANAALFAALLKHLAPSTRLSVACAIGWPAGWCKTRTVGQWRQSAPALDERLPAVFLFQAG